jgi:hypothetical protein
MVAKITKSCYNRFAKVCHTRVVVVERTLRKFQLTYKRFMLVIMNCMRHQQSGLLLARSRELALHFLLVYETSAVH